MSVTVNHRRGLQRHSVHGAMFILGAKRDQLSTILITMEAIGWTLPYEEKGVEGLMRVEDIPKQGW